MNDWLIDVQIFQRGGSTPNQQLTSFVHQCTPKAGCFLILTSYEDLTIASLEMMVSRKDFQGITMHAGVCSIMYPTVSSVDVGITITTIRILMKGLICVCVCL